MPAIQLNFNIKIKIVPVGYGFYGDEYPGRTTRQGLFSWIRIPHG